MNGDGPISISVCAEFTEIKLRQTRKTLLIRGGETVDGRLLRFGDHNNRQAALATLSGLAVKS